MQLLVTKQTTLAARVAGKAAMYRVLPAYDSFAVICKYLARIPDANDCLFLADQAHSHGSCTCKAYATLNSNTFGTAVIAMTRLLLFPTR